MVHVCVREHVARHDFLASIASHRILAYPLGSKLPRRPARPPGDGSGRGTRLPGRPAWPSERDPASHRDSDVLSRHSLDAMLLRLHPLQASLRYRRAPSRGDGRFVGSWGAPSHQRGAVAVAGGGRAQAHEAQKAMARSGHPAGLHQEARQRSGGSQLALSLVARGQTRQGRVGWLPARSVSWVVVP